MLGALVLLGLLNLPTWAAQGGGQLCVKAFEDRDGSLSQDANEPLLTQGLNANLIDSDGVIILSAVLDEQPTAGRGLICFRNLAPGQYVVEINSAEFAATTPSSLAVEIVAEEPLVELEFGARRVVVAASESAAPADAAFDQEQLVERVLVAGAGAAAAMLLMTVLGVFIYMLTLRRRYRRVRQQEIAYRQRTTTGSMRAVRPTDTGEFRR